MVPEIYEVPVHDYRFRAQLNEKHLRGNEIWRGTDVEGNNFISFCVKDNDGDTHAYSIAVINGEFTIEGRFSSYFLNLDKIVDLLKRLFEGQVVEAIVDPLRLSQYRPKRTKEEYNIRLTNQFDHEFEERTIRELLSRKRRGIRQTIQSPAEGRIYTRRSLLNFRL